VTEPLLLEPLLDPPPLEPLLDPPLLLELLPPELLPPELRPPELLELPVAAPGPPPELLEPAVGVGVLVIDVLPSGELGGGVAVPPPPSHPLHAANVATPSEASPVNRALFRKDMRAVLSAKFR
jgi:hypothetical protein